MNIKKPRAIHEIYQDVIRGDAVSCYQKRFKEMVNLYRDASRMPLDTLMYTVYSYEEGDPEQQGNLSWGLTVLEPVTVNGECNMTRGHFHLDRNCAEIYFGISGTGLLLLMKEDGEVWAEEVCKGSLHHIDGHWAHRLVNTGDEEMQVGACWPVTAGHDYEAIQKRNFSCRVYRQNGEIVFQED